MIFLILAAAALLVCHMLFGRKRDEGVTDPFSMLISVGKLLYNKGALILIASILMQAYLRQNGMPFAELLYMVNVVFGVFVVAMLVRLLFFPEVAAFAEDTKRFDSAIASGKYPTALRHYWFGTGTSFAVPTLIAIAVF